MAKVKCGENQVSDDRYYWAQSILIRIFRILVDKRDKEWYFPFVCFFHFLSDNIQMLYVDVCFAQLNLYIIYI